MSVEGEPMNGDRRTALEQRAEAVRSRLEQRLDALDERRDRLVELAKKASRPPVSVVLIGTASLVGVALLVRQLRQRPNRRQRLGAAVFGVPPRKPEGFLAKALKRAALSFVATLAQRASTRGLDHFLPEAPPASRAAVPEVPRPDY
jgi:hypothetical protein